jgi:hypothetical protein
MAPSKQEIDSLKELGAIAMQSAYDSVEGSRDLIKIRIGIWDKLTVLNASTLALSFTAASAFHTHAVGDGGVNYLFASWKLLIISIGLAAFAQHVAATAIEQLQGHAMAMIFNRKLDAMVNYATDKGVDVATGNQALTDLAKAAASEKRPIAHIAYYAGFAAQVLTVVAFYWLYRFARVNLAHI